MQCCVLRVWWRQTCISCCAPRSCLRTTSATSSTRSSAASSTSTPPTSSTATSSHPTSSSTQTATWRKFIRDVKFAKVFTIFGLKKQATKIRAFSLLLFAFWRLRKLSRNFTDTLKVNWISYFSHVSDMRLRAGARVWHLARPHGRAHRVRGHQVQW